MTWGGQVWTLDGIQFHHSADVRDIHGVQWILTDEKGFWGSPATNASMSPRLNRHGVYRSPGWKTERTVSLTARCYAPTFEVLRRAEANVLALLSDPRKPGTLTCHSEIGALTLGVYLDDDISPTPLDVVSEPGIEFSLQLVAPDPRKYSVEVQTQSTGLPVDAGDGLDFVQVVTPDTNQGLYFGLGPADGLVFGTSNASGFITLRNSGTAPSSPVYTLVGPLVSPALTTDTGSTMRYNGILAAGETVVIDPAAPSVLLNGATSRRELMYPAGFDGFNIPGSTYSDGPGELSVGLTHAGAASATGYVEVSYRAAWF